MKKGFQETLLQRLSKLNEISDVLIGAVGIIGGFLVFTGKRIFNIVDKSNARVDILEKNLVSRDYIETQLAPIRQDLNLILSHLLEHRKTEDSLAEAPISRPTPKD